MNLPLRVLAGLLLCCASGSPLVPAAASAQELWPRPWYSGRFTFGTGAEFSSGDFGDAADTDTWYMPISLRYVFDALGFGTFDEIEVRASMPYLRIKEPILPIFPERSVQQGFGDLNLRLGYFHVPRRRTLPVVGLYGKVKLPTAKVRQRLGSGETDYALGIDLSQSLRLRSRHQRVSFFATGEYRFVGDSPPASRRNTLRTSVGTSLRLNKRVGLGLAYDWGQSSSRDSGDRHEISPFASVRLSPALTVGPYAVFGLSRNTPDYAAGMSISLSFSVH